MSEQGAALQTYNQELVKYIHFIKDQREKLNAAIEKEEKEKIQILKEIDALNIKLHEINESLTVKHQMRDDCDRTLAETEAGLKNILESSHLLLTLVQKEASSLKF